VVRNALTAGAAVLALASAAAGTILAGPAGAAAAPRTAGAAAPRDAGIPDGTRPGNGPVVLAGIGGLRWSDISASRTPALWRLAARGSVGSLVVSGISPRTCAADGWLTLNGAARAAVSQPGPGPCPRLPAVVPQAAAATRAATPRPARVPAMPSLERFNTRFHYDPQWGLLATAGDGCATAVGPGAALALASRDGRVPAYLPGPSALSTASASRAVLGRCPLTVIDLGSLPASGGTAGAVARRAAARAADRRLAAIGAALPAGATLVVAAPGGPAPQLQAIVVAGPRYRAGLLTTASTRHPGLVPLTDLTPAILHWRGKAVPAAVAGSALGRAGRASLPAARRDLAAQDTSARVYLSTRTAFFLVAGFGFAALFGLIFVLPWGRGDKRRTRRRAVARAAGLVAAAVPAGTFLASLLPWWTFSHPAAWLYGMAAAWALLIAAAALALSGSRCPRDPLAAAGLVAAVTVAVIGLDLITGSHLQVDTPFGISQLGIVGGRFYGLGNNAVGSYGAAGVLCAAWVASAALRHGSRRLALAAVAAVALFTVIAAGWPGFGAKVGGTIAIVPGFLLLAAAAGGMRITGRRAVAIGVSGLAVVIAFALVNYFVPVTGTSDIGGFVGHVLHGGGGSILRRKAGSSLGSVTASALGPVIPVLVVAFGVVLAWPARVRAWLLVRAYQQVPLLRAALGAMWLAGVLGWFAEDSGVIVPAAELPLVLPLVVVILCSLRPGGDGPRDTPAGRASCDSATADYR
jgi:hypothetical protein